MTRKNVLGHLPPDVQKKLWQEILDDTAAAEKRANAKPLRAVHFPAAISAKAAGERGGRPTQRAAIKQEYERRMAEAKASGKRLLRKQLIPELCKQFKVARSTVDDAIKKRTK